MADVSAKKRIWGWMMFDWASQPYSTVLLTFIFGPYFAQIMVDRLISGGMAEDLAKAEAQAYWGYGIGATGFLIAIAAPVLGAYADSRNRRIPYVWLFSIFYVVGAAALWVAHPDTFDPLTLLIFYGIGMIGMEFATIFTNAMLPTLGPRDDLGRISGNGFALGYAGGVVALAIMLLLFAEGENGVTLIGLEPLFGLDPATREGTRFVGPFTALWYVIFMIPFFLWVRDQGTRPTVKPPFGETMAALGRTLKSLPKRSSLSAFLMSSMLFRDALAGFYTFGGVYAGLALGWEIRDIGIFGIIAAIAAAIFSWLGGKADKRFGPKPVMIGCILILLAISIAVITVSRTSVLGMTVPETSILPDVAYYVIGIILGAAGGVLAAASRTMMVHQADPDRMTEAFGLYALAGKATAFLAPTLIAVVSDATGNQRLGITPLIGLFLVSLILLAWVKPDGDSAWSERSPLSD